MNKFEAIQSTLDHFDFDKVHEVMANLNWKWVVNRDGGRVCEEVPTIQDMKDTAMQLMSDSYDFSFKHNMDWCTSAGGFCVKSFYDDNGEITLTLSFTVCEYGERVDSF